MKLSSVYRYAFLLVLLLTPALIMAAGQDATVENPLKSDLSEEQISKAREHSEKFEFQAEVNRMMKLIIHSLYKAKEIFLRELISNASDALDKIRFMSLTDPKVLVTQPDLSIRIKADPEKKQLIITDSGVGMTKSDLIKNLGTIAKSGTSEFLAQMEKGANSNLIGQFGVGFYSAFLVADKVTVVSKHNNDKQHIWESYAESDFTVVEDPRGDTLGRGTQIILDLKEDAEEYLNEGTLEEIIRKYSEFINFPIYLMVNKTETVEVPLSDEELAEQEEKEKKDAEKSEEETEAAVEEVKEEEKKKTKTVDRWYMDWELMNPHKPIWTRDPKNVTEEEYHAFYKSIWEKEEDSMAYSHFRAEGDVDFLAILYVPAKAESNALQSTEAHIKSIRLFVKRVFITDELLDFIPRWLGFIKGMVDSDDLPLNVSRETLQKHRLLKLIRRKIIRKCMDLIKDLSLDEKKYEEFMGQYGTHLKLGVIEDAKNRKKIMKLLRFKTSASGDKKISLDQYVARMKKDQEQIFFLTGPTIEEIKNSPFVERLVVRGYEVIYFDEPIDEYLVQALRDYEHKLFHNVAKEGIKLPEEDEEVEFTVQEKFKPLTHYLKTTLSQHIDKVKLSNGLTYSPCAIIAPQHGWSGNMERLMSAQALQNANDETLRRFQMMQKKTLEINPKHPMILALLDKVKENDQDKSLEESVTLMYEMTQLRSGYVLKDTNDFTGRIERALRQSLGVDPDAKVEGIEEMLEAAKKKREEKAEEEFEDVEANEKTNDEDFEDDEKLQKKEETLEHDEL